MGIFDKLFGKKTPTPEAPHPAAPPPPRPEPKPPQGRPAPAPVAALPPTVKTWDSQGRLIEVPREEWKKHLPENFKKAWEKPEELAGLVTTCLRYHFAGECLEAALHLQRIDQQPHRGASLLGAALLQLQRYSDAEKVLKEDLQKNGEDGAVLANLAKVFAGLGDEARAERALWRSLEVNPNQDSGLLWFAARQREHGGPKAELEALRKVAALPGSWRPQLWLAHHALEAKDLPAALTLYREVLPQLKPVPTEALWQTTNDLAKSGALKELTEICAPRFDAKLHGLPVSANLIKAYVDLRDGAGAKRILEQLQAQPRPDWREGIAFWGGEIQKLDKDFAPPKEPAGPPELPAGLAREPAKLDLQFVALEGPVWAQAGTPFAEMLPAKPADAAKIAFVCGSAEGPADGLEDKVVSHPSNVFGQFSRGLPMFLAERMHIKTSANVSALAPWMKSGGFVVSRAPITIDDLVRVGQKPDYAVFLHVVAKEAPWRAGLSLVHVADKKTLAEWKQPVEPNNVSAAVSAIAKRMLGEIHALPGVSLAPAVESLYPPTVAMLGRYVSGLEQALAVYCASRTPDTKEYLYAERSILDVLLDLCLRETDNGSMRMLLLSTVEREAPMKPEIVQEYRERLERLQREHPLHQPAQGLTDAALARIYAKQ